MLTTIYTLILAGIILLPALLFYLYDEKQQRLEKQRLFRQLVEAGLSHHLSFTSQELAGTMVFGLDGIHRKMLVVEKEPDGELSSTLIDLNKVCGCTIQKRYPAANKSTFGGSTDSTRPSAISLSIYTESKEPFEMVFYSNQSSSYREAALLEKKAKHWEQLLSKMVVPAQNRA